MAPLSKPLSGTRTSQPQSQSKHSQVYLSRINKVLKPVLMWKHQELGWRNLEVSRYVSCSGSLIQIVDMTVNRNLEFWPMRQWAADWFIMQDYLLQNYLLRKDLEIYTQKCLTNKMLLYSCFQKKVRVNTCYDFVCAPFSHQIHTTPIFLSKYLDVFPSNW